jgi:hypothetical protein
MTKDKIETLFLITACMYSNAKLDHDIVDWTMGSFCIEYQNGYSIFFNLDTNRFELYREIVIPGGYWEPDDVDIVFVQSFDSPWKAIEEMEMYIKRDEIQNAFESIDFSLSCEETIYDNNK